MLYGKLTFLLRNLEHNSSGNVSSFHLFIHPRQLPKRTNFDDWADYSVTDQIHCFHAFLQRAYQAACDFQTFYDNGADGSFQSRASRRYTDTAQRTSNSQHIACSRKGFSTTSSDHHCMCTEAGNLVDSLSGIRDGEVNKLIGPETEDKVSLVAGVDSND